MKHSLRDMNQFKMNGERFDHSHTSNGISGLETPATLTLNMSVILP